MLIGKTVATSCATVFPQATLVGHWEIKFFGSQLVETDEEIIFTREDYITDPIIDLDSEQDIVNESAINETKTGWVKGDFHTHTIYSDGSITRAANIESAMKQGLDFFVTTEHNVVTSLWPKQDRVAIYGGCELTIPFGHTNFLGINLPILDVNGMPGFINENSLLEVIEANHGNGLMSINHPFLDPWAWTLNVPLAYVSSMELINDPTYADNNVATGKAFDLWSKMWNLGWKIAGIGGSDSHLLPSEKYPESDIPSLIGDPATFVYVNKLSRDKVLNSITAKHTKFSRIGIIEFTSDQKNDLLPGMQLTTEIRKFKLSLPEVNHDYQIEWILDGQVMLMERSQCSEFEINENLDLSQYHWLRADVKDVNGIQIASVTPVYWSDMEPIGTTYQEVLNYD